MEKLPSEQMVEFIEYLIVKGSQILSAVAQHNCTITLPIDITKSQKFNISQNQTQGDIEQMPYLTEGTLFRRKSGDKRWEARLTINGKQVSVACCRRQEDAYNKLKNAIKLKKQNKLQVKEKTHYTVHSWLDTWYMTYKFSNHAKKTRKNSLNYIANIKKKLPDRPISKADEFYFQTFFNTLADGRTKLAYYTLLKECFAKAAKPNVNIIKLNPLADIVKPKYEEESGRALLKEEVAAVYKACLTEKETDFIDFYLNTGIRPDEIIREKAKHVNFAKNEIYIDGTKTPTSRRFMPIMPKLKPVLKRLLTNNNEYLFDFKSYKQVAAFFDKIRDRTSIDFTLKDLRHTFATNCKDAGIPIEVYSKWLGHSNTKMTKHYTHETHDDYIKEQEYSKNFATKNATKNCDKKHKK